MALLREKPKKRVFEMFSKSTEASTELITADPRSD